MFNIKNLKKVHLIMSKSCAMWKMAGGSRSSGVLSTGRLTPTISSFSFQYSAFQSGRSNSPLKALHRQRSFTRWNGSVDTVIRDWLSRKLTSSRSSSTSSFIRPI